MDIMFPQLTIVIPVRIDSREREENLNTIIHHLLKNTHIQIIVLEADTEQKYRPENCLGLDYHFVRDNDPVFYRTRYINRLLHLATTEIVGVWDSDVLLPITQINQAIQKIAEGCSLCIPYREKCISLDIIESKLTRQQPEEMQRFKNKWGSYSVGGAFLINKKDYLSAGGENEDFYGWGPEDIERIKRMEILEYKVDRVPGNLYHLYHPRGSNSKEKDKEREILHLKILLEVCRKNKQEMLAYVNP